uniref:E3 ubiquitin-protein ligase TRIM58-like n=1 Tax=Sinocyclocheilus rhinocerous TaxID=307959 RepID=A0A673IB24_9TELE
MASPTSMLAEEQVHCSICLDVFTNPVSIPCGHNFCMACIGSYWKSSALFMCPMCKKTFFKQPDISINTVLREIAEKFKEIKTNPVANLQKTTQPDPGQTEVQQMIQERLNKVDDIKHSLELNKSSAQKEIEDSMQVFSDLIRAVQKAQAELVLDIEEKQRKTESWANGQIQELEQEIDLLKLRNTELEYLSHTEDHIHFLQTCVYADACVGTTRRTVLKLEETLTEEVEKLVEIVDITFDPDTANPWLQLSEDGRQMRHLGAWQDLADTPERFDTVVITLSREGLSSGRHYWEVQVGEKDDWYIGVARASVNRKGRISVSTAQGYWALAMKKGQEYRVSSSPPLLLSIEPKLKRVGVYVDYEEGQVSFYDVQNKSHIYTFMDSFKEKLFPFFYLYCCDKASDTMMICPVQETSHTKQC